LLALAVELNPLRVAVLPDLRLHGALGARIGHAAQLLGLLPGVAPDRLDERLGNAVLAHAEAGRRAGAAAVRIDAVDVELQVLGGAGGDGQHDLRSKGQANPDVQGLRAVSSPCWTGLGAPWCLRR